VNSRLRLTPVDAGASLSTAAARHIHATRQVHPHQRSSLRFEDECSNARLARAQQSCDAGFSWLPY